MDIRDKRIAILSPVAWRTPPRAYGAWETVASNIAEGLVARGWRNVTLFATKDSVTQARLVGFIERGYEEDRSQIGLVSTCLHISQALARAGEFDLIHNHFDYLPLTYLPFIRTPMLTTIHGFSHPDILRVYRSHKDTYYVSISDADRDPELPYVATVYNGIDLSNLTFREQAGDKLVFLGRIHPDKGTHLAIEVARRSGHDLLIAGIIQDQPYFDSLIKPHLNESSIQYIGPVDPIQRDELFRQAYATLHLNTIPERFGLVLAESMAAGVPVIAADLGSCREVVKDGATGFLVHNVARASRPWTQDHGQNARATMDEAVAAVGQVETIDRRQCRRHVEENFSLARMAERYEQVYEEVFRREAAKGRTRTGTD